MTSHGIWRAALGTVLLVQLILLRYVSRGHFAGLMQDGEAIALLSQLHTFTKITVLASAVLIISAVIGGRLAGPIQLPKYRASLLLTLHSIAMGAMFTLVQMLPVGSESPHVNDTELWPYAAFSAMFLTWQLTALRLIAPYRVIIGWHVGPSLFLVSVIVLGSSWSISGDSFLLRSLRAVVEDGTMDLSIALYTIFGAAEPTLSMHNNIPILATDGFAISIAPSCAGYQGMLASATAMIGLIALEWRKLRHNRALMLGLVAIIAVFVLNALRIALLFHIGVSYSPKMAVDGFHSYFGTLSLIVVIGAAMLAMQHPFFQQAGPARYSAKQKTPRDHRTDPDVEAGQLIQPLAIYLGIGIILGLFKAGFNWPYPLLAITGLWLVVFWRYRIAREFNGKMRPDGFALGFAIYLLWIAVVPSDPEVDATFAAELNAVPLSLMIVWILFRLIGFSIVVPVLEELAFRGGLWRLIESKISKTTGCHTAAMVAFALSSLAFGVMHADVLAGTLAGAGFGLLVLRNGRVGDAIIAHAVTNFLLAITAMATGQWSLW
jgi:exosortase E/protease (VPEID-CTERM system)